MSCPLGPGLDGSSCPVPFVYIPNELFLLNQKVPLFLPLIPGRKLDARLDPPAEPGRGLLGDDWDSGDAVCARLKESRFRRLLGRFGDLELGVPGEYGIGLDAYADAVYVVFPKVCGVCGWGLGDGVGDTGKVPGIEGEGLATGTVVGVMGRLREDLCFSGVTIGTNLGGGGEGGGAGIDVPDVSDSDSDGGNGGRLKSEGSGFSGLSDDVLLFDMMLSGMMLSDMMLFDMVRFRGVY